MSHLTTYTPRRHWHRAAVAVLTLLINVGIAFFIDGLATGGAGDTAGQAAAGQPAAPAAAQRG